MKTNTPLSHPSPSTQPSAVQALPSIDSPIPPATPHSALRPPQSEAPTPHSALRTPQSEAPTPPSAFRTPHSPVGPSWRHTGKVARLPKSVRDKLNHLLQDGVPYADIIKALGDEAKGLNLANLSRWKDSGYKDWLLQQAFFTQMRFARETAVDLTAKFDSSRITQAALQLATLHIFQALHDLSPGSLDEKLGGDSAAFARLLNALSRSTKETLSLQSRRDTGEAIGNALAGLGLSSVSDDDDDEDDDGGDDEASENETNDEDAHGDGPSAAPPGQIAAPRPDKT